MRIGALIQFFLLLFFQLSGVRCQVSGVRFCMSPLTCHMSVTPTATATDPTPAKSPSMHSRMFLLILIHCIFACWWLIVLMSTDRQTDRKIDRLMDRQTGRETYRQTDRQTDRQPKLVSSTIAGPVMLQLDKSCLNNFKLPSRPFYRRRGPPFLKRYKFKFFLR